MKTTLNQSVTWGVARVAILLVFTSLSILTTFGQEGPGGVDGNTQNRFWYDASSLTGVLTDANAVSAVPNKGGNTNSAFQNTASRQPLFRDAASIAMNGLPVLRFDGANDFLTITNNNDLNTGTAQNTRSYSFVIRTGANVTTRQVIYEEGGTIRGLNFYVFNGNLYLGAWNLNNDGSGSPWGFSQINTPVTANTEYIITMVKSGNGTSTGTINGFLNGTNFGTINGVGTLYAHSGAIAIGAKSNDTYFETGSSSGTGNYFNGDIAEFIHYNTALNTAERKLLGNYLSSKYNITYLATDDEYSQDTPANGDYDFQVAGIGQATDGSNSLDGAGRSIIRVNTPSGMGNGEFLLWGHDGAGSLLETSAQTPATVDYRLDRTWRAGETGDVGTVSVIVDITGLNLSGTAASDYFLLIDATDSDFSTGATILNATSFTSNTVTFTGVSFANGDHFTLGINAAATGTDGPAGVLSSTKYRFWYEANDLATSFSNGLPVSNWNNKGGNGTDATSSSTTRPLYRDVNSGLDMNGYPVLVFDGVNDRLSIADNPDLNTSPTPLTEYTFVITIRTGSDVTTRQMVYEEGGGVRGLNIYIVSGTLRIGGWNLNADGVGAPWGFSTISTPVSADTEYIVMLVMNGNTSLTGTIDGYLNGTNFGTISGVGQLYAHSGDIGIGYRNGGSFNENGSSNTSAEFFAGAVAEFIHYNCALNDARRIILQNYLSAKYDIGLNINDEFNEDDNGNGDYDHEVAGIGSAADGSQHLDAKGPGIVRMYLPTALDASDYLIWGHDDEPYCNSQEVPAAVNNRLLRVWRATETADVGTVTLSADLTGILGGTIGNVRLLTDTDGDFSDATAVAPSSTSGNIAYWTINLADNTYFTFGSDDAFTDPDALTSNWTGNSSTDWFNNGNWDSGVPTSSVVAIIPSAPSNQPTISGQGAEVRDLQINAGATLTISGSDSLQLHGSWTNNGTFVANQSTIAFVGDCGAGNITNGSATDFYDIYLNNTRGVTAISGQINLTNALYLDNGSFRSNGLLQLVSDASGTARIPTISGTGRVEGDVITQRYIDAGPTQWRFLCMPAYDRELLQWNDDFVTSGFPNTWYPGFPFASMSFYDESVPGTEDNGYVTPTDITNVTDTAQGVWVWCGDQLSGTNPFTIDVTGVPVQGNVNLPVSYTNSGLPNDDGWNMVGNPYPCTIDWESSSWTKTNINNAIRIWNPEIAAYASYAGGVGTNGGSQFIASSQAFWVQSNAASPVLTSSEDCKVDQDASFIKAATTPPSIIRLQMVHGIFSDEAVIHFEDQATAGFDPNWDARDYPALYDTLPQLSVIGNHDYSILTQPMLTGVQSFPIRTTMNLTDSVTIRITEVNEIDPQTCLVLEDTWLGINTPVQAGQEYTFQHLALTSSARFILHVVPAPNVVATDLLCAGDANGSISAEAFGNGALTYQWFDEHANLISSNTTAGNDSLTGLTGGTYTLSVAPGVAGCAAQTVDVTIMEPLLLEINASVVDASCATCCDGIITAAPNGGTGNYDYYWWDAPSVSVPQLNGLCTGVYALEITDANGCTVVEDISVGTANGITENESAATLSIFPNPADDLITISINEIGGRYELTDITGKLVQQGRFVNGSTISIASLPAGVYQITAYVENQTPISQRIVVR